MVLGVLGVLVIAGAGVGAFLYTRGETKQDDKPKSAAKAKTSASAKTKTKTTDSALPPLPAAPEGMVAIRGKDYTIGCDPSQHKPCFSDEQPMHDAKVATFAIMTHEVSMEAYDQCVADKKCPAAGTDAQCTWQRDGHEKHPINCVTAKAAQAFCAYKGWRLPTEIEWEAAARSEDSSQRFPWGAAEASCDVAVMRSGKPGCGTGEAMAAGSRPKDKSPAGVFDMGGNVREWTSTKYGAYPGGSTDKSRSGNVNRGGSYLMSAAKVSTVYTRGVDAPGESQPDLGFRCAADL